VVSGTWVYIWQLFGASNQLLAALSLLVVTVWLVATRRNALYAGIPMVFMYVTTMAATLVTAYNLLETIFLKQVGKAGHEVAVVGSVFTFMVMGDLIGVPVLPPYYALRLVPYLVGTVPAWRRRVLRERQPFESDAYDLHGV